MPNPTTVSGSALEVEFSPKDIFWSRTDKRGVIEFANTVFQRISGFEWDDLVGAPHKVVRHADMPRGVFQLFWDMLKADDSIVAYVKNRTAEGRAYWVLAFATPIDGGYVSVRIKPSSALFQKVTQIYQELRAAEHAEKLSPEESRDRLLAAIQEQGFEDLGDFMANAIAAEVAERAKHIDRPNDRLVAQCMTMLTAIRSARDHAREISELFDGIRNVPTNIRILAAQLEQGSGPISVISNNHGVLSNEMLEGVEQFRAAAKETEDQIRRTLFMAYGAALMREVLQALAEEVELLPDCFDPPEEMRLQQLRCDSYFAKAQEEFAAIAASGRHFHEVTAGLKRHVAGLDVTRIMCKIEQSRLNDNADGLAEIIAYLEKVQAAISRELVEIEHASHQIKAAAARSAASQAA